MKGHVVNYRGSLRVKKQKQMIIQAEGIDTKADTKKIIGKKVVWTTPSGKKIEGIITQAHGCKGAVRVHFLEKGLPGQAIGTKVDIE
jgi:large subunit ribosomal protein L35Ae